MKKCAVYTRVSTANQAEIEYNSCESQKEKIMSYIKSQENLEFFREYSDPGFTGSNLDRPALKNLLEDIGKGAIDAVLTYKIDRLTRSSKDFYSLIEFFEKHGASFVSVTEQFDTSSPSGRLLRNIMLTFAQFEREMIAERVRDKMLQRAEKGMWNNSRTPFGYDRIDKKLVLNKKEAEVIKGMFEEFVRTGSSARAIEYARKRRPEKGCNRCPFSTMGITQLLANPLYVGQIRWSKKVYKGLHEPIISNELFEAAQGLWKNKVKKRRISAKHLLLGLVRCAECGTAMTTSFTNKPYRRYYYYKCYKVCSEGKNACSTKEVNAQRLEGVLFEFLTRIAEDKQYIENLAFRMAHGASNQLVPERFEPSGESCKTYEKRLTEVLKNFKEGIAPGFEIGAGFDHPKDDPEDNLFKRISGSCPYP